MKPATTRWDWYEFTFDDPHDPKVGDIQQGGQAGRLATALGAGLQRAKGRNGYAVGWSVVRGEEELAVVYGHSARAGEVHVVVTSTACDEVVPICRRLFREHRVSRADSSLDLSAEFGGLDGLALAIATRKGMVHSLITNSEGGATRYVGAPTSDVRMRVYRKTEQLRSLLPRERWSEVADGIVRVEVQVRPGKRLLKERVSRMEPDDLWGLAQWSAEFARAVADLSPERVATNERRPSQWSRTRRFLGEQYSPAVARQVAAVGIERVRQDVLDALGLG